MDELRKVSWSELKEFMRGRVLKTSYLEREDNYFIRSRDTMFLVEATVEKNGGAEQIEFESMFKDKIGQAEAIETPPFSAKTISGFKLFRRKHGQTVLLAPEGDTTLDFTVPYALCKINEIQTRWFPEGVTVDFLVAHPQAGVLAQHGFGVPIAAGKDSDFSNYDATLRGGLILRLIFHNASALSKTVGVTWVLHEMVGV